MFALCQWILSATWLRASDICLDSQGDSAEESGRPWAPLALPPFPLKGAGPFPRVVVVTTPAGLTAVVHILNPLGLFPFLWRGSLKLPAAQERAVFAWDQGQDQQLGASRLQCLCALPGLLVRAKEAPPLPGPHAQVSRMPKDARTVP